MGEIWKPVVGYENLYEVSNLGRVKSLKDNKGRYREKIKSSSDNGRGYLNVYLCKNGKGKRCYIHRLVAEAFLDNPNNYPIINHKDENKQNNHVSNLEWCDYEYNNTYGTCVQRRVKTMRLNGGYDVSEETRKKLSEMRKGEKHYMYGKHHTEKTRREISEAKKGQQFSEETRKKISKALKGKMAGEKHPLYGKKGKDNSRSKKVRCIEIDQVFECTADANEFLGKDRQNDNIGNCARGKQKTAWSYHWEYVD